MKIYLYNLKNIKPAQIQGKNILLFYYCLAQVIIKQKRRNLRSIEFQLLNHLYNSMPRINIIIKLIRRPIQLIILFLVYNSIKNFRTFFKKFSSNVFQPNQKIQVCIIVYNLIILFLLSILNIIDVILIITNIIDKVFVCLNLKNENLFH